VSEENEKQKIDEVKPFFYKTIDDYLRELGDCYQDLLNTCNIHPHEAYYKFEECVRNIGKMFNDDNVKTKLWNFRISLMNEVRRAEYTGIEEKEKVIDALDNKLRYINTLLSDNEKDICRVIDRIYENIKTCPFGQEENRSENASEFEKNVIEMFQWLFIDELELMKPEDSEIKEFRLKRDGIFKIADKFELSRCGLQGTNIKHLIIECKNYCKPSYRDLMQVYAYTIMSRITRTCDKPLCCIISRENPDYKTGVAMKMRDRLYQENDTLIIFLSVKDLHKMKEIRGKGDPFSVFKEKMDEMNYINLISEN